MNNKKIEKAILDIVTYLLLSLGAVIMVTPFLWMIATSFKRPADQFTMTLIPNPATLDNYRSLFNVDLNFPLMFANSTVISLLVTMGQLLTCSMAAFCFAVVKFRGREALFAALLATLLIPFHVTLIPNFIIFKWLGLTGTSVPIWLPAFWGGAFGTFSDSAVFSYHPPRLGGCSPCRWRLASSNILARLSPLGQTRLGGSGDFYLPGCLE